MGSAYKRFSLIVYPVIFLVIGVALIVMGIGNVVKQHTYKEADAVITSITRLDTGGSRERYEVIVKFTADGKEYESRLGSYSGGYSEGDTIAILYDPVDPAEITIVGQTPNVMYFGAGIIAVTLAAAGGLRYMRGRP